MGRGKRVTEPPQHLCTPLCTTFFQDLTSVFPWSLDAQQFQAPAHRRASRRPSRRLPSAPSTSTRMARRCHRALGFCAAHSPTVPAMRPSVTARGVSAGPFPAQGLTEYCFACHSRLPNLQPFDLGQRFLAATNVANLSVPQRLKLEVATRQMPRPSPRVKRSCAPQISRQRTSG